MDDLQNLEYLSLVSKICTELDNHLSINDKDLAEFIIEMAKSSGSYEGFRKMLADNQADFPDSFSSNLYRIIQKLLPSTNRATNDEDRSKLEQSRQLTDVSLRKAMCPVLCMPNDPNIRVG